MIALVGGSRACRRAATAGGGRARPRGHAYRGRACRRGSDGLMGHDRRWPCPSEGSCPPEELLLPRIDALDTNDAEGKHRGRLRSSHLGVGRFFTTETERALARRKSEIERKLGKKRSRAEGYNGYFCLCFADVTLFMSPKGR